MNRCRIVPLCLSLLAPAAPAGIAPNDAALILDTLLDMENPTYRSTNERGESTYNALQAYQDWAALYWKYAQQDQNTPFREDFLRIYLFLGQVAQEKLDAATTEAFTSDLMPLYEKHGDSVLRVLRDLPFLVPSTCRYLSRYFGFEDKNHEKRPAFLAAHADEIKHALAPEDAKRCMDPFRE
jgi:hypothetical protein